MKKIIIIYFIIFIALFIGVWFVARNFFQPEIDIAKEENEQDFKKNLNKELKDIIDFRRVENAEKEEADLFGADNKAQVLLIGLDKRVGQTKGHCDAIQLITIDREKQNVTITAVPRGTYSPLPPGKGATSSDYYISNACDLGGLDYGIKQIEKILGQKADYLVVVGFSEVLGIFRNLKLPAIETLRWLRQRQGYAVGEPQRAHNHSTFLKQMIIKFLSEKNSKFDKAWQYVVYKMVKTDLSFAQTQEIADVLADMDFIAYPERIQLAMRPAYNIKDIPYSLDDLNNYLNSTLKPTENKNDHSKILENAYEEELLKLIGEKINERDFVFWAYENNFWLQIENNEKRLAVHYDILEKYLDQIATSTDRKIIIADYILEMENYAETAWIENGQALLKKEINQE